MELIWHKYPQEKPTRIGHYLCVLAHPFANWSAYSEHVVDPPSEHMVDTFSDHVVYAFFDGATFFASDVTYWLDQPKPPENWS